jgi:tetratricopeptide (TPR) repeat protein
MSETTRPSKVRNRFIVFAVITSLILLLGGVKLFVDPFPKAMFYYAFGKIEEALSEANQAVAQDPQSENVYRLRASIFRQLGQNQSALADYTKAIELDPSDFNFDDRAEVYERLGRQCEAIADYSRSIQLDSTYDRPYIGRASALNASGHYKEAIDDYSKAIELERPDPLMDLYLDRGQAYLNAKQWQNAFEDYSTALKGGEDSPYPYEGRGLACLHLGQPELAKQQLEEAIRLHTRNRAIYTKAGRQDLVREEDKRIAELEKLI